MFVRCLLYLSNESISVLNSENIVLGGISHSAANFGLERKDCGLHSVLATSSDGHMLWDVNY